ncbi:MAG: hypothetical protein U0263_40685 [Polyangiaceae bacterium]
MKTLYGTIAFAVLGATLFSATGCKVEDCPDSEKKGGVCVVGKSLTKFNGTPSSNTVDYQAGTPLSIEGVYGNINVTSGAAAGKVEVTFEPFDYEGHDEKDLATRQMNDNLKMNTDLTGGVHVTAVRTGDTTNGLGANITVKLPADFDGSISVYNHGNGPLNEFDLNVGFVGKSTSVSITNDSGIGDCKIQGAATVTDTKATCGDLITVLDVSDNVNITKKGLSAGSDATVVLRMASIAATAAGGSIVTEDGSIDATFPATGTYAIQAFSPTQGIVTEGTPPASCTVETAAPGSKTITCGAATPLYKVTAGQDGLGDSNINLSYK